MAKNTNINLGEHFDQFIATKLVDGRYSSASEVVRAGLRLLETEEQKLETLRKFIAEGKASGEVEYSYEKFIAELDEEFG